MNEFLAFLLSLLGIGDEEDASPPPSGGNNYVEAGYVDPGYVD